MHLNNLVGSLEIKIGEKDKEYQELCNSISGAKINNSEQRRSSSLTKSRKSFKSTASDRERELEIKNLKEAMQQYTIEEKNMLERLQHTENERQ